jgi:hypothetical protein
MTKREFHTLVYKPALRQRRRERLEAVGYWSTILICFAAMFATAFLVGSGWPL